MTTLILPVLTDPDRRAAAFVRNEVFEQEMGISVESPASGTGLRQFDVIAWTEAGDPAATLTVVETSGDTLLHMRYDLSFPRAATVARYAQLAVRRQFRGSDLPAHLILKAYHCFVQPQGFDFSWLLFPAAKAENSLLCRRLGFRPELPIVMAEYGRCRALVRDEHSTASRRAMVESARYLHRSAEALPMLPPQTSSFELRV